MFLAVVECRVDHGGRVFRPGGRSLLNGSHSICHASEHGVPARRWLTFFFRRLKNLFKTSGFKDAPDLNNRIWNCDETGFCTAVASKAVLTRRGAKEVHETAGGSGRDYITVLGKFLVLWCVTSTFFLFLYVSIHIFLLIFGGGEE